MLSSPEVPIRVETRYAYLAGGSRMWFAIALSSYSEAAQASIRALLISHRISSTVFLVHSVWPEAPTGATEETTLGLLTRPVIPTFSKPRYTSISMDLL